MTQLTIPGRDSPVSEEQYRLVREGVVLAARQEMFAREVIGSSGPAMGFGVQEFSYDKLAEMSAAHVSMILEEIKDRSDVARTSVDIPIIQKVFKIEERDLQSSERTGQPINVRDVNAATYQCSLLENKMILLGLTATDPGGMTVPGLYNSAGQSYTTSKDWATYGNPADAIEGAIILMQAQDVMGPYNAVVNPVQNTQLLRSQSPEGVRELPTVIDLLNQGRSGGGNIWADSHIVAGTGMVVAANGPSRGLYEYKIAKDLDVALKRIDIVDGGGLKGRVYLAGRPVVYVDDAIGSMTNI